MEEGGGGNQQENGEPFTKLERSTDSAFSRQTTSGANWISVDIAEICSFLCFLLMIIIII